MDAIENENYSPFISRKISNSESESNHCFLTLSKIQIYYSPA